MTQITVTLDIETPAGPTSLKRSISFDGDLPPGGDSVLLSELVFDLQADLLMGKHVAALPLGNFVENSTKTFSTSHLSALVQSWNSDGVWLELHNSYLQALNSLARAKSYRDVEPNDTPDVKKGYYCHFEKMTALNYGTLIMVKIQDLVVRLLFETFGTNLITVDQTDPEWPKELSMSKAKTGLARLHASGQLELAEKDAILAALETPNQASGKDLVIKYRNAVAHRVTPSVDYPEFSQVLQPQAGTPLLDSNGNQVSVSYAIGPIAAYPDFTFDELYAAIVEYLGYVSSMLKQLKALPRFA